MKGAFVTALLLSAAIEPAVATRPQQTPALTPDIEESEHWHGRIEHAIDYTPQPLPALPLSESYFQVSIKNKGWRYMHDDGSMRIYFNEDKISLSKDFIVVSQCSGKQIYKNNIARIELVNCDNLLGSTNSDYLYYFRHEGLLKVIFSNDEKLLEEDLLARKDWLSFEADE